MKTLCIIPARGGSKRIPRKNLREFRGVPILGWSIRAARDSDCFDDVVLSTDDAEIARVGESLGASVPFMRHPETATDHATTAAVLIETLTRLRELGQHHDAVCCLYPTAPFTTHRDLQNGLTQLTSGRFDVVLPVARFDYPIWRSFRRDDTGQLQMNWPEHRDSRSQDLPPAYHDAGQWCWFRPEALFEHGTLLGPNTGSLVLPSERVQDIDTEDDWLTAEWKHERIFK
ncbi:pseudaminic acid cytidylyltransferase [Hydrogenophaga sp. BPS33]|uniref:pseudaminic acid cytidylyltransferase n=1 Tax=Hydrogenophaga sp. BPS33 TaxID=2651974 RepID=UPI00132002E2|nr:pseudaminic acid cytidylyltransferase [Hydrogenophaga sp. BPS33]QHE83769.1 pseudaminic acid cytidylyltransferase [Hydrogenophaga sp. BPS33]